jgi:membrane fusion protein (multidrug efflux system)
MNRIILSVIFISCVTFFSCKQKEIPPTPPTPVNLYTVKTQNVLYYDEYPSTTQALSQVDLHAEVQGYITGIFFTEGSQVKKGQKLYEIDRRLYQESYDAAAANLKVAESSQKQAQQDADRYEYLNSYNAVAKQVLDHAVIALQTAKDQVKAAEQAVKTAETNLTYSVITAPFDGTIGFSQVKLGNLVSIGQTILNTISTVDPMAVDFLINEKQLPHFEDLAQGKDATDSLFTILLPNNALYPFTGKISVIDRAVDPETGTLRIRLVFPNPKFTLRAGMSCIVRVHNQEAAPQLVIPNKAVVEQMGEYFVFIAKDTLIETHADSTKKDNNTDTAQARPKLRAFQVKIQVGQAIGGNIIVKDGLKEGDKIIVDGIQSLHDGSPVTLSNKRASPQSGNKDSTKTDSSKNNPGKN